jgi:predicted nucleic acid-binding protein
MSLVDIFLDSSALVAGIISSQGAARALLPLGENARITLTVSEQVVAEVERSLACKVPKALPFAREIIFRAKIRILRDPPIESVQHHLDWISHAADVPILVAAWQAQVDFLATLNSHHFLNDPEVTRRSGLRIDTPGDALTWLRGQLAKDL